MYGLTRRQTVYVGVIVTMAVLVAFGITAMVAVATGNDVPPREIVVTCVGEDSCSVPVLPKGWHADYRNNEWHITEGK